MAAALMVSPLGSLGQPASKPVIGYLSSRSPEDTRRVTAAFLRGLAEGGFEPGKNVAIEYRWARGRYDRLPQLATELVQKPLAVLVATGGEPAPSAAKLATSTIPIVFSIGSDPVKAGLVKSYGRPGGNATGVNLFTTALESKRLQLMRDLMPSVRTIGFLSNPSYHVSKVQVEEAERAASLLNVKLELLLADSDAEIDTAFKALAQKHIDALVVGAAPFFDMRRQAIIRLAARYRVPTIYQFREYAQTGGLMSYGIDLPDAYRQVGVYAARVLKGAKPADLPILQPTKVELVLNRKAAKALGISIPAEFLARVDEVVE